MLWDYELSFLTQANTFLLGKESKGRGKRLIEWQRVGAAEAESKTSAWKVNLRCRTFEQLVISTEGALTLPTTYDNHPSNPIPSCPNHKAINDYQWLTNDYQWLPMTTNEYQWLSKTIKDYQNDYQKDYQKDYLKWSIDLRWLFNPALSFILR